MRLPRFTPTPERMHIRMVRDDMPRGSWAAVRVQDHGPGLYHLSDGTTVEVIVRCPQCGVAAELDHTIAADGLVSPSVGCPNEGKGCSFHVSGVVLDGWRS